MNLRERLKKWLNFDNAIDVLVDAALVVFDAFTTPMLIPLRLGKYYLKLFVKSLTKRFLKGRVNK